MKKEHPFSITPDDMRRHTEHGYALLDAVTRERGFDPVAVIILSTLIFNTHTWLLHKYVLKNKNLTGVELRDE